MSKVLLLILIHVNVFAFAQSNCKKCEEQFKKGEFAKAKEDCVIASKSGDANCQAFLGIIYLSNSDTDNAKIWFEKSANQGNPVGQNGLGYLYQNGLGGLSKDITKANSWFLKSAKQGNTDSQFWLGENLFLSGRKSEGFQWTLKASLNGSPDAQYNLAVMYLNGEGTKRNESSAMTWLIISATNGNYKSKSFIDRLKAKLTKEQYQNYYKTTEEFLKKNPKVLQ